MSYTDMGKRAGVPSDTPPHGFSFQFHSPDFDVPHDVHEFTHEKLRAKLHKYERYITEVIVHLKDENGMKGGEDKQCRIEAIVAGFEPVIVLEKHHDVRAALEIACDRLDDAVHRHIERARTKRRDNGRKMVRNNKLSPS
jgi:putative sigma-54 modulation protein